ncbi:MAG: 50S ribosomal protein L18 [Holosporaceae bacterium]|jgi:large subunit ribosomal protein L18|nr:50S ribosomal protein L18 [Holosporaceae bacterium]
MARFNKKFERRAKRVRYKIRRKFSGRPRLSVFRSERHIYAQIIDDSYGKTLCAASTLDKSLKELGLISDGEAAARVGALLAARAVEAGVREVVFDRGGYNYHGRVKALAESARSNGLLF